VHYARSANAIDETRKDFDRVAWGGVEAGVPDKLQGHWRLVQWWFAGNHSDIGGGYPEVESRLSDIALSWMVEEATVIPNALKVGAVWVNGAKMKGTGDAGEPLHIFPAADGVPLRANDGETSESLKFSLEGEGQPSWSCSTKRRIRTMPPGPVRREAGGRP
jgi:type VI secretion system (T6SS) phospholipase Tle1-like effector